MDDLTKLFPDVADALGIESVAIVEKDHYIVELLRLLQLWCLTRINWFLPVERHCQKRGYL
jgi:hypothetical protein